MGIDLCACIKNQNNYISNITIRNQENIINENITTLNNNSNHLQININENDFQPKKDLNNSVINDSSPSNKNKFNTIVPFIKKNGSNYLKNKNLSIMPANPLKLSELYKNNSTNSIFNKRIYTIKRSDSGFLTRTKIFIALFGYDNSGKKTFYKKMSEKKVFSFNKKKYEIIIVIFSYNKDNIYNIDQKFDFFLILYDIGDIDSFNAVKNILTINDISNKKNKNVIIIANKSDLYDKSKYILPDDLCNDKGYKSYIISIKTDQNFYINVLTSMFEIFGLYNS